MKTNGSIRWGNAMRVLLVCVVLAGIAQIEIATCHSIQDRITQAQAQALHAMYPYGGMPTDTASEVLARLR